MSMCVCVYIYILKRYKNKNGGTGREKKKGEKRKNRRFPRWCSECSPCVALDVEGSGHVWDNTFTSYCSHFTSISFLPLFCFTIHNYLPISIEVGRRYAGETINVPFYLRLSPRRTPSAIIIIITNVEAHRNGLEGDGARRYIYLTARDCVRVARTYRKCAHTHKHPRARALVPMVDRKMVNDAGHDASAPTPSNSARRNHGRRSLIFDRPHPAPIPVIGSEVPQLVNSQ